MVILLLTFLQIVSYNAIKDHVIDVYGTLPVKTDLKRWLHDIYLDTIYSIRDYFNGVNSIESSNLKPSTLLNH